MPSLETAKALKGEPIHYEYQNTPKGAGGNDGVGRNNF
jgi:hypothetical protein